MRRFSGTEKGGLLLAGVLVIAGLLLAFHPVEMWVPHPGIRHLTNVKPTREHVSKETARIVGWISVIFGAGIFSLVLYQPKK